MTIEEREILGDWQVTITSMFMLQDLIHKFENDLQDLKRLYVLIFTFGGGEVTTGNAEDILVTKILDLKVKLSIVRRELQINDKEVI